MKNLIYKDFKLSIHTTSYLFLILGSMLLIPSYPYYVAFFYQTLGIFFMFMTGNSTNDVFFTAMLPIRKRDAVKARFYTVLILELLQIIVSVPFAILRTILIPMENGAGIEANTALFGLAFVMFGLFNITFLPMFYKTGNKTGMPFMISCLAMTLFAGIAEVAININRSWKAALDTINPEYLPQQIVVLAAGIIVFGLLSFIAYEKSAASFERLDL